jgi:glycogen(starch) synthase
MRIAMVSRELPPHGGGIGSYTEKTARALAARGHEVHVLSEATHAEGVDVVDGVRIHRLRPPRLRPRVLARSLAVHRALRRLGPVDVVQACEWGGEAWAYSLRRGAPLVTRLATPHVLVEELNGVPAARRRRQAASRWLERSQTRRSDRVISPSAALADEVGRRWGLDREAIMVVPTGIRPPRVTTAPPAPLDAARYVLYFGRLEVRKGVDVWIDALPEVLRRHPDLLAVLVGEDVGIDGRPFPEVARERCGDDLWPRVRFLPRLPHDELFAIVAGAALVIMPSRWENMANACLEAMALGRPVVATTGSGFAELIDDGLSGRLVPPGDSAALGGAVVEALADEAALRRMGEAARRRALDFDLDVMAERLLTAYSGLHARTPRRALRGPR